MTEAIADVVRELAPGGTLRAAINYGNGVLAQRGDSEQEPRGTASDLARELARRLGVPVHFVSFEGAGGVFDAAGAVLPDPRAWDIAFLAIEPARATEIAFTAPYVLIEGTYLVRGDASYKSVAELDAPGRRILVTPKSAYDLYLTRTLQHAELVRLPPPDPADVAGLFARERLDAIGGVRQLIGKYVAANPDLRLLPDSFMQIRQAMGTKPSRPAGARYLRGFVEEMKASGFVAEALARSGQSATVAPAEA
ncbi:transporter substrate-binding domain-containing protein [Pseudorhodoplanes sp.]|uniref:transporter substrate-binding domain-containing protein n=1 Tax=Pseudorhodoplanes sp. TaxID=1934341 RepID=UPI00391AECB8